jgi:dimeric dUTPase (all-alpha-NTP-PPase superfamily)
LGLELFDIFFNTVFLKILRGSPSFTLDKMQELHHLVGELVEIEQKTNLDVSIPYQQYKMNVLIGGNAWRLNPKMNYINAIIDESGEFLGSTGYEWWKAKQLSPKDEMNQITEYIDIYHFLLSLAIKCLGVEDTEKIIASIVKESTNNEFVHFDKYDYLAQVLKSSAGVHLTLKRLDLALFGGEGDKKLMDFSNECTKRDIQNFLNIGERFQNIMKNELIDAFRGFFSLGKKLNLTVEETDNLYILKYALNVTRKNNGYKEGTYNKEWRSLAGMVEDNYIVFGEKAEWTVTIPESAKDKKAAELLVGMYDASLDAIRPHSWNFNPFYQEGILYSVPWMANNLSQSNAYVHFNAEIKDVNDYRFDNLNWFGLELSKGYGGIRIRGAMSKGVQVVEDNVEESSRRPHPSRAPKPCRARKRLTDSAKEYIHSH